MFEYNCVNASDISTSCCGCLKIGDDVRFMTSEEQTLYSEFVQVSNEDVNMSVCLLCAHLLKKLRKFIFQCQEAYNILNSSLLRESKPHTYVSQLKVYNLSTTQPQITEFHDNSYDFTSELVTFDDAFDDEDIPLVLLKKEDGLENDDRVKKKKFKKKHVDVEDNGALVKLEDVKSESLDGKALREGFSSRIVQETGEYVVIKLTKEQESKPHTYVSQLKVYNLSTTQPQITEFHDNSYDFTSELVTFDDAFDDEDIPLVLLKKEDGLENDDRVKKKKFKKKHVDVENNGALIKSENVKSESLNRKEYKKIKCKKKPKKELREGFSSRMVQETEEYVVIKLTKEQVLQEMQERSNREEYQRTLFKCEKCVKGFNFEDVLRTHMEKHSMENGSLQCDICTQYCPSAVSLRGHMKSHTTRYKCKVCGCVRQSRQHLLEHHSTVHTVGALSYTCLHCDFSTTKRTSMQRHVKSHSEGEKHACHQCGKLFKSEETLRVHTMRHDKSKRLQCEECNRMFIYPSLLHRHVQAVHVRKDYYCVECDVEFKSRENLRLHFKKAKRHRDASSYQYECSQCTERFVSPSTLSSHVTAAHGSQKQHACAACRRLYSSRDALRAHARAKHSPAGGVSCAVCGRSFTRKSILTTHMRTHAPSACDAFELADKVHKKLEESMLTEVPQATLLES